MKCVYCQESVPGNWYEHHCRPVARIDGHWVDMYNHLKELSHPVEEVAYWACYLRNHNAPTAGQSVGGH